MPGSQLGWLGGQLASGVAGVDGALRLDQQDMRFLSGLGAVLDAARDDEQLTGFKLDVAITQVDRQPSAYD